MAYDVASSMDVLTKVAAALKTNGVDTVIVNNATEARAKVLSLVPADAEVMVMTSATLDTIGLSKDLDAYPGAVRPKLYDSNVSAREKKKLGSAPQITVGSVHAVTMDGHVLIASASGSQLAAYVYGADRVIWVVGGQKIVKDVDNGQRRIKEYVVPLEDARARAAYGVGTAINNLLIMNANMFFPGRITMILVAEKLGF